MIAVWVPTILADLSVEEPQLNVTHGWICKHSPLLAHISIK